MSAKVANATSLGRVTDGFREFMEAPDPAEADQIQETIREGFTEPNILRENILLKS